MKTIAAIDALAKHFEQRVRDINADTKEKYTEELNKARSEYGELVQRISDFDPIMLPIYTDKPEQMIKKIVIAILSILLIIINLGYLENINRSLILLIY